MPRKGWRKPRPEVGNPSDPEGLAASLNRFIEYMKVKNFSASTIETRVYHIYTLIAWCDERSVYRPDEVTKPLIELYQKHLRTHRKLNKLNGNMMTPKTQAGHITSVRVFFKWLARKNLIPFNPASEIELPKTGFYLPHGVLSEAEVEQILNDIDIGKRAGIRDRAIIEVLYSTGIRRKEACDLDIYDLKEHRGVLMIRQGKGKQDRVVPIGERAIKWVQKYLVEVRSNQLPPADEQALFLSSNVERFTPHSLGALVKKRIIEAGIEVDGSCHVFRHSMATLMLENGADIRYIQQLLGHSRLETTQIYTRVAIEKLKEIHTATHPARLHREEKQTDKEE